MKIFLSGVEGKQVEKPLRDIVATKGKLHYNLMSFYYIKPSNAEYVEWIIKNSEQILIDSGAHIFQFGKKVNWVEYTESYAQWIKDNDRSNIIGYFEMDIENIIGYDKVKELRKILEAATDKIIPVWHPDRGIHDYEDMCKQYKGKVIAIGGFRGTDIKDEQFLSFVKVARKYNCKVHCLGMTRAKVLDKVPFDFTDSSTWLQETNFGKIIFHKGKKRLPRAKGKDKENQLKLNYLQGMKMQEHYYNSYEKSKKSRRKKCQLKKSKADIDTEQKAKHIKAKQKQKNKAEQ